MNIISRRSFLERSALLGTSLGLAAMTNLPLVMRRALAAGVGTNGKKMLFIFLRGANDGLNAMPPVGDPNYFTARNGPTTALALPNAWTGGGAPAGYTGGIPFIPSGLANGSGPGTGVFAGPGNEYLNAVPTGNGYAALHPSHKFLAPVYNKGNLALIDRCGYPKQSRSHFDSQNYWENGLPGNNILREGIFYRAIQESIDVNPSVASSAFTGMSVQSALPLSLIGDRAAMTNLSDPTRYDLLGLPNSTAGNTKFNTAVSNALSYPFATKNYRALLNLQYSNLSTTLPKFDPANPSHIDFTDAGNAFYDGPIGDATFDTAHPHSDNDGEFINAGWISGSDTKVAGKGYWLFPHSDSTNGGWRRAASGAGATIGNKYVIQQGNGNGTYSFMRNVKAAALLLNNTSAIIAGTEFGGFDTHNNQINNGDNLNGQHANLQRAIAWSLYSLFKFFKIYGKNGTNPQAGAQCSWDDLIVVTMSEFGRTTVQNATLGTDHAEAQMMFVAGGKVNGFSTVDNKNGGSGIYCASDTQSPNTNAINVNWTTGSFNSGTGLGTGTLFDATGRYLKRAVDFRSVLGEIIREHLGASQAMLNRIIPGYANESGEHLLNGGAVTAPVDSANTTLAGEVRVVSRV